MKSEDELWDTGKEKKNSNSEIDENNSTLDLSEISPEKNNEEIILEDKEEHTESEDGWAVPLAEEVNELNLQTVGIVGGIVILLLTGILFVLLNEEIEEISVPNEKYEEQINYNVNGFIDFNSNLDIPLPLGFFDNDVIINTLDVTFEGDLSLGIQGPKTVVKNGYGESKTSVFKKYIEQQLDDVDGSFSEKGMDVPAELKNSKIISSQTQYIDSSSLKIIRTDTVSNASTAKISGIGQQWAWQSATDWIPRDHTNGILPHGGAYIGKTLTEGDKGVINEGGIELTTKVTEGEKIKDYNTVKLEIKTSFVSDILGYEYMYNYKSSFYMSEISSLPLKFVVEFTSYAKTTGSQLYSVNLKYSATAKDIFEGYEFVPTKNYDSSVGKSQGEFLEWENGAPALGASCDENSDLNPNFNLQTGIQTARNNITLFDKYVSEGLHPENEDAFVIEANYSAKKEAQWNFTMATYDEQSQKVDGWIINYNTTTVSGNESRINNPILRMEDIKTPLTICSAENLLTDFEEIAEWTSKGNKKVNYNEVELILGQNLISKQSLTSPTSILEFTNLDPIKLISDLNSGNYDLDEYSNNIDVDTAGSYAYFLDKQGGSESLGYNHQEVAGVDARDGLVMFNLQSRTSI